MLDAAPDVLHDARRLGTHLGVRVGAGARVGLGIGTHSTMHVGSARTGSNGLRTEVESLERTWLSWSKT